MAMGALLSGGVLPRTGTPILAVTNTGQFTAAHQISQQPLAALTFKVQQSGGLREREPQTREPFKLTPYSLDQLVARAQVSSVGS